MNWETWLFGIVAVIIGSYFSYWAVAAAKAFKDLTDHVTDIRIKIDGLPESIGRLEQRVERNSTDIAGLKARLRPPGRDAAGFAR